jgi:hypothetical protein
MELPASPQHHHQQTSAGMISSLMEHFLTIVLFGERYGVLFFWRARLGCHWRPTWRVLTNKYDSSMFVVVVFNSTRWAFLWSVAFCLFWGVSHCTTPMMHVVSVSLSCWVLLCFYSYFWGGISFRCRCIVTSHRTNFKPDEVPCCNNSIVLLSRVNTHACATPARTLMLTRSAFGLKKDLSCHASHCSGRRQQAAWKCFRWELVLTKNFICWGYASVRLALHLLLHHVVGKACPSYLYTVIKIAYVTKDIFGCDMR